MKATCLILSFIAVSALCFAIWSTDPSAPTLLAGFNNDQVIPKLAITPNGQVWHGRFDNASGNYDVYLQLYSSAGELIFTQPGGICVSSNPAMSWLTDWGMDAGADGSAVLTFQDIRLAGVNNVYAYKIDQDGTQLWGENGIALTTDTNTEISNMTPIVFCSSDGSSYVAWQKSGTNTSIVVNRLSSTGVKIWGETGIEISFPSQSRTWPQIIQADGDNILLKYYADSGPFWAPTRHLYIAKYSPDGTQVWNTAVSTAGGISAWNQILDFKSDGTGGGIIAWYDDRNSDQVNEVYVQRITSEGDVTMPENGALISTDTANQQYYPKIAICPQQQRIFAFYKVTNAGQTADGLSRQMLDFEGNRYWGETGTEMISLSQYVTSTVAAYYTDLGAICLMSYGMIPSSDQSLELRAYAYRVNGLNPWDEEFVSIASNPTNKYHFDLAVQNNDWSVLAWEEGLSAMDIYGMRLNQNGSLGMIYPAPINLTAEFIYPNSIAVAWEPGDVSFMPESYALYVNNELYTELDGTETQFTIENLQAASYEIFLVAIYPGDIVSDPSETVTVIIVGIEDEVLPNVSLKTYPNPFKDRTSFTFTLKQQSPIELNIYNLRGQKVSNLLNERQVPGEQKINWDGCDDAGNRLANGIYFYRLSLGNQIISGKILLSK